MRRAGKVQLIDASKCFEKRRKPLGNKRVELTTACRELIMQAYHAFTDDTFTATLPDGTDISVESRVKPNDYFKFSKVVINRPQRNEAGDIVLDKKGKPVIDKALKDTEIIPWLTDINAYLEENVRPYAPDFMMSPADTKIGYEIPSPASSTATPLCGPVLTSSRN